MIMSVLGTKLNLHIALQQNPLKYVIGNKGFTRN
jgi:hypothetical protein